MTAKRTAIVFPDRLDFMTTSWRAAVMGCPSQGGELPTNGRLLPTGAAAFVRGSIYSRSMKIVAASEVRS
jgi:hypothetical protein